jgi:riboflavin biosynthesis pyrimidine reductase
MTSSAEELIALYSEFEGLRLSMVVNSRLQTSGASKTSADVSNSIDRELLKHLRSVADIAVTDLATAVAESYGPSRIVEIEVWTKSGNSRGLESMHLAGFKPFSIVTVEDAAARIKYLLQSHSCILLETGPTVSKKIASEKLIDEACITVTEAENEDLALQALTRFADDMALRYLTIRHHHWVAGSLFARLSR